MSRLRYKRSFHMEHMVLICFALLRIDWMAMAESVSQFFSSFKSISFHSFFLLFRSVLYLFHLIVISIARVILNELNSSALTHQSANSTTTWSIFIIRIHSLSTRFSKWYNYILQFSNRALNRKRGEEMGQREEETEAHPNIHMHRHTKHAVQ